MLYARLFVRCDDFLIACVFLRVYVIDFAGV
jgi:hypothetical protein